MVGQSGFGSVTHPSRRQILMGLGAGAAAGLTPRWTPASAQTPPAANEIMVTLLGTGSPTPRADRFGPSTLIEAGGKRILIDAGRGLTIRLNQIKVPLGQVDAVFLTHFHSDHLNGLPDFWLTGYLTTPYAARKRPMRLIGPTGTRRLAEGMRAAFADDIRIRLADEDVPAAATEIDAQEFASDGIVYDEADLKVTAFEVNHGPLIKPAYGYRVDYRDKSVLLSGDTKFDENLIQHGVGVDLLVHEVCMLPDGLRNNLIAMAIMNHHTSPEECGVVFTRTKPRLAVYSHIVQPGTAAQPSVSDEAIVTATRRTYQGPLTMGQDLMRFVVGAEISTMTWDPQRGGYPT